MFWFYFLIYGIAFGILCGIAVKNKNRDQFLWFLAGLVFGIFGLIAAVLVDKIELQENLIPNNEELDISKLTKKCSDCAEVIKLEAKVCRFCQHKFWEEEIIQQIDNAKKTFNIKKQENIKEQVYIY